MKEEEIVKYLNNTVYCRLGPSKIHGVGVFAIRDIPKGTLITDHNIHYPNNQQYTLSVEMFLKVHDEIRSLILDRFFYEAADTKFTFYSPNSDQFLQAFMNHSDTPNSDGHEALRDIKAGEEVVEDFTKLTTTHHPLNILNHKKRGMVLK